MNDDQVESSEFFMGRLVLRNNQERVELVPDTVVITIIGRDAGKSLSIRHIACTGKLPTYISLLSHAQTDGSTGTVIDGSSPTTVVEPLSVECQFDTSVVAGVIAALVAIIVILTLIVIVLSCCLAHYKRGQKYDVKT